MELQKALHLFELQSIDQLTADGLKRQFKQKLLAAHPDRGGKSGDFEDILQGYDTLCHMLSRMNIESTTSIEVREVIAFREKQYTEELHQMVNQVLDTLETKDSNDFNRTFNAEFDKVNGTIESTFGHGDWLKGDDISANYTVTVEEWNARFEQIAKAGKDEPAALILHPNAMAQYNGSLGTDLMERTSGFGSDPCVHPTYSDVRAAYTSENTVIDKVPTFHPSTKTLSEQLEAYQSMDVYAPLEDAELKALSEYEEKREQAEKERLEAIREYFKTKGSSYWALPVHIKSQEPVHMEEDGKEM